MKRALKVFSLLILVSMAAYAGKMGSTPTEAAHNASTVRSYLNQGFTMGETRLFPVLWKVEPTGNYLWGQVEVLLHKTEPLSLKTTTAVIRFEINHVSKGGGDAYKVNSVNVTERILF